MATKDSTPTPKIEHSEDGRFVHYGFEENGVFHALASERTGDYEERIQSAKEDK